MSSDKKAYPGSCHCGKIQYLVKLSFPPVHDPPTESIRIYKCNCSTCQKMGYFHLRPIDPANDYIITSPTNIEELGDYRCFKGNIGWYFCRDCGVRIVGKTGEWVHDELDVEEWAGTKEAGAQRKVQKVWKAKGDPRMVEKDGQTIARPCYLSVNAVTLEPSEEIDLRKWHEKGWVFYVESRRNDGTPMRLGEPHEGGMY